MLDPVNSSIILIPQGIILAHEIPQGTLPDWSLTGFPTRGHFLFPIKYWETTIFLLVVDVLLMY